MQRFFGDGYSFPVIATPKETLIDRIERVLADLMAQKKDEPTTH